MRTALLFNHAVHVEDIAQIIANMIPARDHVWGSRWLPSQCFRWRMNTYCSTRAVEYDVGHRRAFNRYGIVEQELPSQA